MGVIALLRLRPPGQPRGRHVESHLTVLPEDPGDGHDDPPTEPTAPLRGDLT